MHHEQCNLVNAGFPRSMRGGEKFRADEYVSAMPVGIPSFFESKPLSEALIAKSTVNGSFMSGPPKVDVLKRLLPQQWSIMPFFRQLLGPALVHAGFGGSPSWVVIMGCSMDTSRPAAVSFPTFHDMTTLTRL